MRVLERFERHRADDVRRRRQPLRLQERQRSDAAHYLGPVDQRQPLFRFEAERLESGPLQGAPGGDLPAAVEDLSLAGQGERDVGQRSEIPGGTHRALLRNDRDDPGLEQLDDPVQRRGTQPRVAADQAVGA